MAATWPLLVALLLASHAEKVKAGRTNVVVLLADDLGFGDPGYQGGRAKTPHLDAMSKSPHSLVFNRFYCGGAVCSPTRASILTGRTPNRVCMWDFINRNTHMHLPHSEFTLGHAASVAGMTSGHFGKWHLGHFAPQEPAPHNGTGTGSFNLTTPAHVGFDEYYSAMPLFEVSTTFNCGCFDPQNTDGQCVEGHWKKPGGCDYMHAGKGSDPDTVLVDTAPMLKDGYGADNAKLLVDHFEGFANRSVAAGKAFMGVIWFQNVHVQYTAVEEFTALYPVGEDTTQQQQDFWGSLSAMDAQIGRVRAILQRLNVADDTIVWFTSDNGPEVGQPGVTRGLVGRKRDFTEGGIRMPSMLEWPAKLSVGPYNITHYPAVATDILPTVMEVLGVTSTNPSWQLDGMSLLPLINDPTLAQRPKPIGHATGQPGDALTGNCPQPGQCPPGGWLEHVGPGTPGPDPPLPSDPTWEQAPPPDGYGRSWTTGIERQNQLAWTDNAMKLWGHRENGTMVYRLFNISSDWYELNDLSASHPGLVSSMRADLFEWYSAVLRSSSRAENNCRAEQSAANYPPPAPTPRPSEPMPASGSVFLNTTNMFGAGGCGKNNTAHQTTLVGKFDSFEGCQAACKDNPTLCVTWTWHHTGSDSGCYAAECFLRAEHVWEPRGLGGPSKTSRPYTDCGVR